MTRTTTTTSLDDYWQQEEHVARLLLPPRDHGQEVFFLWHSSPERYGKDHRELGIDLSDAGERQYVHVKAYYYAPRIILSVSLARPVETPLGEEIGEVTESRVEGADRHFIANLQAWYYPTEKSLMLWEVDMSGHYGMSDPTRDFLLGSLWYFFERGLLSRFRDCERIVTPGADPSYSDESWREFLKSQAYQPHRDNTFIKLVTREVREIYE